MSSKSDTQAEDAATAQKAADKVREVARRSGGDSSMADKANEKASK